MGKCLIDGHLIAASRNVLQHFEVASCLLTEPKILSGFVGDLPALLDTGLKENRWLPL
jgi:hypothetical protein